MRRIGPVFVVLLLGTLVSAVLTLSARRQPCRTQAGGQEVSSWSDCRFHIEMLRQASAYSDTGGEALRLELRLEDVRRRTWSWLGITVVLGVATIAAWPLRTVTPDPSGRRAFLDRWLRPLGAALVLAQLGTWTLIYLMWNDRYGWSALALPLPMQFVAPLTVCGIALSVLLLFGPRVRHPLLGAALLAGSIPGLLLLVRVGLYLR